MYLVVLPGAPRAQPPAPSQPARSPRRSDHSCSQNAGFRDGYNEYIDRTMACKSTASIYATVADACPCNYPNNAYSNERWCVGAPCGGGQVGASASNERQAAW